MYFITELQVDIVGEINRIPWTAFWSYLENASKNFLNKKFFSFGTDMSALEKEAARGAA